jgi:four helix bundle protein
MPQDFKELNVWKLSYELTKEIYKTSQKFPKEEKFGLTNQIKRASFSIPVNIAEGSGRRTNKDFQSFLHNALGSTKEVECLLLLAKDFNYISQFEFTQLNEKLDHVGRMLTNLIKSLEDKDR